MLPDIQLDDRRFEDLVAEAKRRIPGYTPEWTDLNDSDPGMTLVQLFAWLAEMMLWRLNRVPDKNFIKFLGLVGIDLKPAVPATALATFPKSTAISFTPLTCTERPSMSRSASPASRRCAAMRIILWRTFSAAE